MNHVRPRAKRGLKGETFMNVPKLFSRTCLMLLGAACLTLCQATSPERTAVGGEEELPSFRDLVKPLLEERGGAQSADEGPKFPPRLSVAEANLEGQYLLAPGPLCYLTVPNARALTDGLGTTAIAGLLREERVERFFKSNDFGVGQLFTDLPPAYASEDSVELLIAARRFVLPFLSSSRRVHFAVYRHETEGMLMVFLADIGRDRQEAFDAMIATRDAFLEQSLNLVVDESPHDADFIDVIRADNVDTELAYGIVRNFAVVCTSAAEARAILKAGLEGRGDDELSRSIAYADMGTYTDGESMLKGFIDLRSIRNAAHVNALPTASEMLALSVDFFGQGSAGGGPRVIYYDLRSSDGKVVENVVSPIRTGDTAKPGVPARVASLCVPSEQLPTEGADWITPRLIPYQPEFVVMAHTVPQQLSEFLALPDAERLGESPYAQELSVRTPEVFKQIVNEILKDQRDNVLGGEVALAVLPARVDVGSGWLIALSVKSVAGANAAFAGYNPVAEANGVAIRSMSGPGEWEGNPCWAVFDQTVFTHLKSIFGQTGQSCMVVASSGELMQDTIDQVTALSSLADNKDFVARVRDAGRSSSMVTYLNLRGMIGRGYVHVPSALKRYYPRLEGVSNLPPMSLVNSYATGFGIGTTVKTGAPSITSTLVGPAPLMPGLAGLMTLKFPLWVRERSRLHQRYSRENLGRIWIELQTFATQRGHFPESYDDLRNLFEEEARAATFTSDAAVDYLGAEAAQRSYNYLPGLRATDEPDLPVVWESEAWHYEYSGMFPEDDSDPKEEGVYRRYRLVLRLDGTIKAYSEDAFRRHVLPRIRARE